MIKHVIYFLSGNYDFFSFSRLNVFLDLVSREGRRRMLRAGGILKGEFLTREFLKFDCSRTLEIAISEHRYMCYYNP